MMLRQLPKALLLTYVIKLLLVGLGEGLRLLVRTNIDGEYICRPSGVPPPPPNPMPPPGFKLAEKVRVGDDGDDELLYCSVASGDGRFVGRFNGGGCCWWWFNAQELTAEVNVEADDDRGLWLLVLLLLVLLLLLLLLKSITRHRDKDGPVCSRREKSFFS